MQVWFLYAGELINLSDNLETLLGSVLHFTPHTRWLVGRLLNWEYLQFDWNEFIKVHTWTIKDKWGIKWRLYEGYGGRYINVTGAPPPKKGRPWVFSIKWKSNSNIIILKHNEEESHFFLGEVWKTYSIQLFHPTFIIQPDKDLHGAPRGRVEGMGPQHPGDLV